MIDSGAMSHPIQDLAQRVSERWSADGLTAAQSALGTVHPQPLPEFSTLNHLLATCFYASLLREESRPVRFRLSLVEPSQLNADDGPPIGLHRLRFLTPRPFSEQELRRLSSALDFHRSLIGVRLDETEGLLIWGIVHSGPGWVHDVYGGLQSSSPAPDALMICVTDTGRMTVRRGSVTIASINGHAIGGPTKEVFETEWFLNCFASVRGEIWDLHSASYERAGRVWAKLDQDIVRRIAQQVDRRVISTIRNSGHGGTLVFLPREGAAMFGSDNAYMIMRHQFMQEEPRNRFRTLMVSFMNTLAEEFGPASRSVSIDWNEYETGGSESLTMLEEAIMEVAHLIAGLAAMDGAVVLTNKYELLGCGAEIACELEKVPAVAKALDAEALMTTPVATDIFGARHRSVHRLCHALHDVMSIVISQDRTVHFVKWMNGVVTYWDQVATSVFDI